MLGHDDNKIGPFEAPSPKLNTMILLEEEFGEGLKISNIDDLLKIGCILINNHIKDHLKELIDNELEVEEKEEDTNRFITPEELADLVTINELKEGINQALNPPLPQLNKDKKKYGKKEDKIDPNDYSSIIDNMMVRYHLQHPSQVGELNIKQFYSLLQCMTERPTFCPMMGSFDDVDEDGISNRISAKDAIQGKGPDKYRRSYEELLEEAQREVG